MKTAIKVVIGLSFFTICICNDHAIIFLTIGGRWEMVFPFSNMLRVPLILSHLTLLGPICR